MASPYLGFPYFALVTLFYRQTNGFEENHTDFYIYWKTLPVLMLSILCFLIGSGAGLRGRERIFSAVALFFGALGDYLISIHEFGLVIGASSFGVGHIFYLITFAHRVNKLNYYVALVMAICGSLSGFVTLWPVVFVHPIACCILMTYTTTLSTCVVLSASIFLHGGVNEKPKQFNNLIRLLGFLLFYCSDTVLAINFLAYTIPFAEKIVLLTYFGAQYMVLWGTCLTSRLHIEQHVKSQ